MMKKIISLFVFVFFTNFSLAQYYDDYSSYGLDKRIGASLRGQKGKPKTKKFDYAEESAQYFKKELNLDDLQTAIFKSLMTEYLESATKISESGDNITVRREKISIESEKMNVKFVQILNKDQIKKYDELKNKKDKKSKKNKKSDSEENQETDNLLQE